MIAQFYAIVDYRVVTPIYADSYESAMSQIEGMQGAQLALLNAQDLETLRGNIADAQLGN